MRRVFRTPTVHAALRATAFQRTVAFLAMFVAASTVLYWPEIRDHAGSAIAQAQDNNYQPFQCGQQNSTNVQARRSSLNLFNNSGTTGYTSGKAYPCISGVAWRMIAGGPTSATITAGTNNVVAEVSKIYTEGPQTLNFAGTGNASNLAHLGFASLVFCDGTSATNNANYINGYGCVRKVSGIQMYASPSTSGGPTVAPSNSYTINVIPGGAITLGGSGVLGDLWATGDSRMALPMNALPFGSTGCSAANGNAYGSAGTANYTCDAPLSGLTAGLAQNLAAGSNFAITAMNLTFYYLITHKQGSTNPYDGNELSNPSLLLPATRLAVGNGS